MTMETLTERESDAMPKWETMERVYEIELEVDKVDPKREVIWLRTEDSRAVQFAVAHVAPDTPVGKKVRKVANFDYVTVSAKRLRKGDAFVPTWFLTEIGNLRDADGPERNVFG